MEYVIPLVLVLVIVTAGVVAFVMNAQRKTGPRGDRVAADDRHTGGPGIGADATPLGDTAEHAGQQTRDGETVGRSDAVAHGGTGRPVPAYGAAVPEETEPQPADRPPEPEKSRDDLVDSAEAPRRRGDPPDSEQLADRPA
jgi:hypothetical protein